MRCILCRRAHHFSIWANIARGGCLIIHFFLSMRPLHLLFSRLQTVGSFASILSVAMTVPGAATSNIYPLDGFLLELYRRGCFSSLNLLCVSPAAAAAAVDALLRSLDIIRCLFRTCAEKIPMMMMHIATAVGIVSFRINWRRTWFDRGCSSSSSCCGGAIAVIAAMA